MLQKFTTDSCFLIINIFIICTVYASELPSWHLKPLGRHIEPSKVDETFASELISSEQFANKYVLPRKPIVFRDVVKEWPAFELWSDAYLSEKYGDMELRLEGKREKGSGIPKGDVCLGRDRMKTFINEYRLEGVDKYIVSELPTPMWKDVEIPSTLSCGEFLKAFVEIDLWMNSDLGRPGMGGNSIIHKDAFNTLNCVLNGSKEWKLIELKYNDHLYQSWEGPMDAGYGGFSLVNPDEVDAKRFPNVGKIPRWYFTTIKAGDCIYLPSQMWHQVKSYGMVNRAVSFLFSQFNGKETIDTTGCAEHPIPISLSDVDVDLQYSGTGIMSMGNAEIDLVRNELKKMIDPEKGYITKKGVFGVILQFHEHTPKRSGVLLNNTKIMYKHFLSLAGNTKEDMTIRFVDSLARAQIRPCYTWMFPIEPSSSYEHEYSHFLPEELEQEIENMVKLNEGVLERDTFVAHYERMGGTSKFAHEFWMNLAGNMEITEVTRTSMNLVKALEKYELYRREASEETQPDDNETITTPQGHTTQPRKDSKGVYAHKQNGQINEEVAKQKQKEEL